MIFNVWIDGNDRLGVWEFSISIVSFMVGYLLSSRAFRAYIVLYQCT